MTTDLIERDIFDKLKQTPKYGSLCDETLLRMASWAAARHASPREALKAAKRKLHQVYGAYCDQCDLRRVAEVVQALPHGAPEETIRSACRDLLRHHASTREREAILDQVFPAIFDEIGPVTSILDLACGLRPFMLPWMAPSDTVCRGLTNCAVEYRACDIDTRLVAILNEFLARLGRPPAAQCRDLLVSVPSHVTVCRGLTNCADVALLLKALPCLEQQEKGAGLRLLPQIPARYLVASFPAQSLGGRAKGMVQHYETYMLRLAAALHFSVRSFPFPSETFYVLARPM